MERLLCYMSSAHMHCREDWIACMELEGRFRELIARCMSMGIREVNMHLHFLANRAQGMARALNATDACMDLMEQADLLLLYENVPEHGNRELGSEIADFDSLFRHYGPG